MARDWPFCWGRWRSSHHVSVPPVQRNTCTLSSRSSSSPPLAFVPQLIDTHLLRRLSHPTAVSHPIIHLHLPPSLETSLFHFQTTTTVRNVKVGSVRRIPVSLAGAECGRIPALRISLIICYYYFYSTLFTRKCVCAQFLNEDQFMILLPLVF